MAGRRGRGRAPARGRGRGLGRGTGRSTSIRTPLQESVGMSHPKSLETACEVRDLRVLFCMRYNACSFLVFGTIHRTLFIGTIHRRAAR